MPSSYTQKYIDDVFNLIANKNGDKSDFLDNLTAYSNEEVNPITKHSDLSALIVAGERNKDRLGISDSDLEKDPQKVAMKVIAYKIAEYAGKVYEQTEAELLRGGIDPLAAHNQSVQLANETVDKLYRPLTKYKKGVDQEAIDSQAAFNNAVNKFAVIEPEGEHAGSVFVDASGQQYNPAADVFDDGQGNMYHAIKEDRYISVLDEGINFSGIGGFFASKFANRSAVGGTITGMLKSNHAEYGAIDEYWNKQTGLTRTASMLADIGIVIGETAVLSKYGGKLFKSMSPKARGLATILANTGVTTYREAVADLNMQEWGLRRQYIGDNVRQQNHISEYVNSRLFDGLGYLASSYATAKLITSGGLSINAQMAKTAARWSSDGIKLNRIVMAATPLVSNAFDATGDYFFDLIMHNALSELPGVRFTESQRMSLGLSDKGGALYDKEEGRDWGRMIATGIAMRFGSRIYSKVLGAPFADKMDTGKKPSKPLLGSPESYAESNVLTKAFAWISRKFIDSSTEHTDAIFRADWGEGKKYATLEEALMGDKDFSIKMFNKYSLATEASKNFFLRYKFTPEGLVSKRGLKGIFTYDKFTAAAADNELDTYKFKNLSAAQSALHQLRKENLYGTAGGKVVDNLVTYIVDRVQLQNNEGNRKSAIDTELKNIVFKYNLDDGNVNKLMDGIAQELSSRGLDTISEYVGNFSKQFMDKFNDNKNITEINGRDIMRFLDDTNGEDYYVKGDTTPTDEGEIASYRHTQEAYENIIKEFRKDSEAGLYIRGIFEEFFPDSDRSIREAIEEYEAEIKRYFENYDIQKRMGGRPNEFNTVQELKQMSQKVANEIIKRHFASIVEITDKHEDNLKDDTLNNLVFYHLHQIQMFQNIYGTKVSEAITHITNLKNENPKLKERLKAAKLSDNFYNKKNTEKLKEKNPDYSAEEVMSSILANKIMDDGRANMLNFLIKRSGNSYTIGQQLDLLGLEANAENFGYLLRGLPGIQHFDNLELRINGEVISREDALAAIGSMFTERDPYESMDDAHKRIVDIGIALTALKDSQLARTRGQRNRLHSVLTSVPVIRNATDGTDRVIVEIGISKDRISQNPESFISNAQSVFLDRETTGFDVSTEATVETVKYGNDNFEAVQERVEKGSVVSYDIDKAMELGVLTSMDRDAAVTQVISILQKTSPAEFNNLTDRGKIEYAQNKVAQLQSRKYVKLTLKNDELKTAVMTSTNIPGTTIRSHNGQVILFSLPKENVPASVPKSKDDQLKQGYMELELAGNNNERTFMIVRGDPNAKPGSGRSVYDHVVLNMKRLVESDFAQVSTDNNANPRTPGTEKADILEVIDRYDETMARTPNAPGTVAPKRYENSKTWSENMADMLVEIISVKRAHANRIATSYGIDTSPEGNLSGKNPLPPSSDITIITGDTVSGVLNGYRAAAATLPMLVRRGDIDINDTTIAGYNQRVETYANELRSHDFDTEDPAVIAARDEIRNYLTTQVFGRITGSDFDYYNGLLDVMSFVDRYDISRAMAPYTIDEEVNFRTRLFAAINTDSQVPSLNRIMGGNISTLITQATNATRNMRAVTSVINNHISNLRTLGARISEQTISQRENADMTLSEQNRIMGNQQIDKDEGRNAPRIYNHITGRDNRVSYSNGTPISLRENQMARSMARSKLAEVEQYNLWEQKIKDDRSSAGNILSVAYSSLAFGNKMFTDYTSGPKRINTYKINASDDMVSRRNSLIPDIILYKQEEMGGNPIEDGPVYVTRDVYDYLKQNSDYGQSTKFVFGPGSTVGKIKLEVIDEHNHSNIFAQLGLPLVAPDSQGNRPPNARSLIILTDSAMKKWDSDILDYVFREAANNQNSHVRSLRLGYDFDGPNNTLPRATHDIIDIRVSQHRDGRRNEYWSNKLLNQLLHHSNPKTETKNYHNSYQAALVDPTVNYLYNSMQSRDIASFEEKMNELKAGPNETYEDIRKRFNAAFRYPSKRKALYAQYSARRYVGDLANEYRLDVDISNGNITPVRYGMTSVDGLDIREGQEYIGRDQIGLIALQTMYKTKYRGAVDGDPIGNNTQRLTDINTAIEYVDRYVDGTRVDDPVQFQTHLRTLMNFLSSGDNAYFLKMQHSGRDVFVSMDNRSPNFLKGSMGFKIIDGVVPNSRDIHVDEFYTRGQQGDFDGEQGKLTLITGDRRTLGRAFKRLSKYSHVEFLNRDGSFAVDENGTSILLKAMNERNVETITTSRDLDGIQMVVASSKFDPRKIDANFENAVGSSIKALEDITGWTNMARSNPEVFTDELIKKVAGIVKDIDVNVFGQMKELFIAHLRYNEDTSDERWTLFSTNRTATSQDDPGEKVFGHFERVKFSRGSTKGSDGNTYKGALITMRDGMTGFAVLEGDGQDLGYRIKAFIPVMAETMNHTDIAQRTATEEEALTYLDDLVSRNFAVGVQDNARDLHSNLHAVAETFGMIDRDAAIRSSEKISDGNYRINNNQALHKYFHMSGVENVKDNSANLFIHRYGDAGPTLIKRMYAKQFAAKFIPVGWTDDLNDPFSARLVNILTTDGTKFHDRSEDVAFTMQAFSGTKKSKVYTDMIDEMANQIIKGEISDQMMSFKDYSEFMNIVKNKNEISDDDISNAYAIFKKNQGMVNFLDNARNGQISEKAREFFPAEFVVHMARFALLDRQREELFSEMSIKQRLGIVDEEMGNFFGKDENGKTVFSVWKAHEQYADRSMIAEADRLASYLNVVSGMFGGWIYDSGFAITPYIQKLHSDASTDVYSSKEMFFEDLRGVIKNSFGEDIVDLGDIEAELGSIGVKVQLVNGNYEILDDVSIREFCKLNMKNELSGEQILKFWKRINEQARERAIRGTGKVIKFYKDGKILTNQELYTVFNDAFSSRKKHKEDLKKTGESSSVRTKLSDNQVKSLFQGTVRLLKQSDKITVGLLSKGVTEKVMVNVMKNLGDNGKIRLNKVTVDSYIEASRGYRVNSDEADIIMHTVAKHKGCY